MHAEAVALNYELKNGQVQNVTKEAWAADWRCLTRNQQKQHVRDLLGNLRCVSTPCTD
ncbi:hypothetical protein PsWM33_00902 [Pseudovibrio sp. WM33]|nr:hypothetical protein PsWM33_00902 [Pseudovibrio sp. WM33]